MELDAYEENKGLEGVNHLYAKKGDKEKEEVILKTLELVAKAESKPQVIIFFNTIPELRHFYKVLMAERNRFLINDPTSSDSGKVNLKVDYIHR